MGQFGEINIPEIREKKNRNRPLMIVLILVYAVIFAALVYGGVLVVKAYNSDERKLIKGFSNLAEEINERQKLWEDGGAGLGGEESTRTDITFNISGENLPVTLGIDISMLVDNSAHKMRSDTVFSVMNNDIMESEIYGDDDSIMISLPDLFEQNLEFSPDNIVKQYNNSLLADKMGPWERDDVSINLFPEESDAAQSVMIEDRIKKITDILKDKDSDISASKFSVEKLDEPVIFSFPEKEEQHECSRYRIVIPKEWIEIIEEESRDLVADMSDTEATSDIARDVIVFVDMDKNNRILRFSLEEPMQYMVESEEYAGIASVGVSISLMGEERSIDDIAVSMDMELVLSVLDYEEKNSDIFDEHFSGEEKLHFHVETETKYDENDICVTTEINEFTISADSIGSFSITGEINAEPLNEEIKPLKGETISLFHITEEEYDDLQGQIQRSLLKWMAMLYMMN